MKRKSGNWRRRVSRRNYHVPDRVTVSGIDYNLSYTERRLLHRCVYARRQPRYLTARGVVVENRLDLRDRSEEHIQKALTHLENIGLFEREDHPIFKLDVWKLSLLGKQVCGMSPLETASVSR